MLGQARDEVQPERTFHIVHRDGPETRDLDTLAVTEAYEEIGNQIKPEQNVENDIDHSPSILPWVRLCLGRHLKLEEAKLEGVHEANITDRYHGKEHIVDSPDDVIFNQDVVALTLCVRLLLQGTGEGGGIADESSPGAVRPPVLWSDRAPRSDVSRNSIHMVESRLSIRRHRRWRQVSWVVRILRVRLRKSTCRMLTLVQILVVWRRTGEGTGLSLSPSS
mmetsp:Transcript_26968/g.70919  ORF Transcript_26968/g.70919 Transcript_26968/m.70919 type:complete len:221 (+) Transcript_26968:1890-2552(+)